MKITSLHTGNFTDMKILSKNMYIRKKKTSKDSANIKSKFLAIKINFMDNGGKTQISQILFKKNSQKSCEV
ncbi:hypothetical protein G3A_09135 [Bacillus sp. 17376]|nr:hypothetical protein G3A_09135 [Bacillus sp. 17376]